MDTESYHGNSPWVNTLANGVSKRQQGEYWKSQLKMLEIGVCAAPCWGIIPLEIVFSGPGTAHQRGSAGAYALPACCSTS